MEAGPRSSSARLARVLTGATLAAVVTLAVVALGMVHLSPDRLWLPMWDMAAHGVAGIRLADALGKLELWRFAVEVYKMAGWPPAFPLLECPVFLGFGPRLEVATSLMNALFALAIGAAFVAGAASGGLRGVLTGAITAALLAASPIYQQFATVVMLELLGTVVVLLSVAAYLAWARRRSPCAWTLVCAGTVLLFFVKYNYGLLWMGALALAWGHEAGREIVREWLRAGRIRLQQRRPFDVFVALYAALLVLILATGGWSGTIAGQRISVRSIGNPLVGLFAICLLRELRHPRAALRRLRDLAGGPPSEPRLFARIVLLPIAVWLVAPLHLREFVNFVVNRSPGAGASAWQGLTYYPRSFATDYTAAPAVGWILLATMVLVCLRWRRMRPGECIVPIAFALGLLSSSAHRYKEPRFFFTLAPFVWMGVAIAVASLTERLRHARPFVQGAMAVGVLVLAAAMGFDRAAIEARHRALGVDPAARDVLARIASVCATSRGTALFGTWNGLSPGLVEWQLRHAAGVASPAQLPRGAEAYTRARDSNALLAAVAGDARTETLLLVAPEEAPASAGAAGENPWLAPLAAAVQNDPRFVRRADRRFPSGYRLQEFAVRR